MGARMAVGHLLSEGYTRIGFLYGEPNLPPVRDRLEGYRGALKQAGIRPDRRLEAICPDLSYASAREGALRLFAAGVDSIFAVDDVMAAAALAAGEETGRHIPEDLGVIGYDDTPMAAWPPLSLTSINQSTVTQGREAGRLILRLMEDPKAKVESVTIPPLISVRRSSQRSRPRQRPR
jgi:LacI family transcriptional regulator